MMPMYQMQMPGQMGGGGMGGGPGDFMFGYPGAFGMSGGMYPQNTGLGMFGNLADYGGFPNVGLKNMVLRSWNSPMAMQFINQNGGQRQTPASQYQSRHGYDAPWANQLPGYYGNQSGISQGYGTFNQPYGRMMGALMGQQQPQQSRMTPAAWQASRRRGAPEVG